MNIENSIPQGWKLGYIMSVYTKDGTQYECQMENIERTRNTYYTLGSTPSEAFTKACDKAREYNIQKLMEECMAREDSPNEEDNS